jgi:zinc-ribbon domain
MTTVDESRDPETQPRDPAIHDPVTTELAAPLAASDRCPNCGARMAPDQRYCIECGERRSGGGLREALPRTQTVAAAPARTRRTLFATPNSSLIAGVGTLLLALGVGVLIGRSGHTTSHSATPQVVTVQTSGAAGGTSAAATTTAGSASSTKKSATHHHAKSAKSAGSTDFRKSAAKSGVKLPPPVVKVGSKCQAGAKGCQGGKFTGNFFGGG